MKIGVKKSTINVCGKKVAVRRNSGGVPEFWTSNIEDFIRVTGSLHAHDRLVQMMLVRVIACGRVSELLKADDNTLGIDIFMREMALYREAKCEVEILNQETRSFLEAYCDGVNDYLNKHRRRLEFLLVGYKPEPWKPEDTLATIKIMAYIGLAQTQQDIEKFIIQSVQNDVNVEKLKSLFHPHLKDLNEDQLTLCKRAKLYQPLIPASIRFLSGLPKMLASNSWMVAPKKSASNKLIQCNDPHLECNRLPGVWYEYIAHVGDERYMGINMPGVPGLIMGRTSRVGVGFTYGFMDMIDYFFEDVKDNKYREEGIYKSFTSREEIIKRKGKEDFKFTIFENDRGVLEKEPLAPFDDGIYLTRAWSGHKDGAAKSCDVVRGLLHAKSADEAANLAKHITISCNWIIGDDDGNIIYQQSGLLPHRTHSGLHPLEGWKLSNNWKGIHEPDKLSYEKNPDCGFICSANEDRNQDGRPLSINMPMGNYRVDRIRQLLEEKEKLDVDDMKRIQRDLYSLQAEKFFNIIAPLIPDTAFGKILKEWNLRYDRNSLAATLFEKFYNDLLRKIFCENLFGTDVWDHIINETGMVVNFYHVFDRILLDIDSKDPLWYSEKPREVIFKEVLDQTLASTTKANLRPWASTREVMINNIFFDGTLPSFLGFDKGPYGIEGNRATIVQGAVYRAHGRVMTFCPSFRFISDFATTEAHTALAGGASDKRFSKFYSNDLENWYNFNYKVLKPEE